MVRGLRMFGMGCLILALAAGQTLAQEKGKGKRGPGFGGMGMGMGPGGSQGMALMLLRADKVQKELDLVQDQKDKLKELAEKVQAEMMEQFSGMRDLSQEERMAKMPEIQEKVAAVTKKAQKQVDEILLPKQAERLKEISLQLRGTQALMDKEVADKLKITDKQKEEMQATQRSIGEKARELFAGGDREKAMEKMRDLQKEASEKALDLLTSEQKDEFAKMKGDKIDFTMRDLMPAGGFGGKGKGKGKAPEKKE